MAEDRPGFELLLPLAVQAIGRGRAAQALPPAPRGIDALTRSAIIFDKLRAERAATLGVNRLADLEDALRTVADSTQRSVGTVSRLGT
jgi:hypothetical protein